MIRYSIKKYIWWLSPGELAGMPMPYIDPARRKSGSTDPIAFDDDIALLSRLGIKTIVSLVKNSPRYEELYRRLGFSYLLLPVEDGRAPTVEQVSTFIQFYETNAHPCAVHCESGVGRTGTMLAAFLIRGGCAASQAIERVRLAQPAAIESAEQVAFLKAFERNRR